MREQTFTQIVTSNLGNIKMIHKIQLLIETNGTNNIQAYNIQNKCLAIS